MTRRPPFWLAALALSCATSKSSESQLQLSGTEKIKSDAEAVVVSHAAQGPTWIWEFAPPPKEVVPTDSAESANHTRSAGALAATRGAVDLSGLPEGMPGHGPLLKLTYIGPSTLDTTLKAKGTSKTLRETMLGYWAKLKETRSYWPPWWLLGGAAAALAALLCFLKFSPLNLVKQLLARIFP